MDEIDVLIRKLPDVSRAIIVLNTHGKILQYSISSSESRKQVDSFTDFSSRVNGGMISLVETLAKMKTQCPKLQEVFVFLNQCLKVEKRPGHTEKAGKIPFDTYGKLKITFLVPSDYDGECSGDFFGGQLRVFLDRILFEKSRNNSFWDLGRAFRNSALLFNKRTRDFCDTEKMAGYSDSRLSLDVTNSFQFCIKTKK